METDDNKAEINEQPMEKWIIDLNAKVFYRHLPRSNDYPLTDSRLVHDLIGDQNIEIHFHDLVLGPYRSIRS